MTYLLDTHAFLWALFDEQKLLINTRRVLSSIENRIFVSTISFWEISLQYNLKKIELENITPKELPEIVQNIGFDILELDPLVVSSSHNLKSHKPHKDPFDRLIIWQAIRGGHTLVSKDKHFAKYKAYGLDLLW